MQKITTHLWYDKEAKEAAEFYVAAFPGATIKNSSVLHGTPSGDVDIVTIDVLGSEFTLISAGPLFKFNPSISFHVKCATKEEVDAIWAKLSPGGTPLMELGTYPFSERFGWMQDKYGLSWQIICVGGGDLRQRITPAMLFVGAVCGRTEEAINHYVSVFRDAKVGNILRYGQGEDPEKEGNVKYASFTLEGQEFGAMDSGREHKFAFNEAISFMVHCKDQKEIDHYWEKLSAVPESEQCGWLKDKFGVSWQIVPVAMDEMMKSGDKRKMARVTEAFLKMKKFDIAELEKAAEGK
ncbi:MAG TPA: VOC family protein [Candidatus Eisenbacteria bacterium]|nr:VOC family protein [Candidatus Eisenbacteria bacterium]